MKLNIFLITIFIFSVSLFPLNISAQSTWQDATREFCGNYVSNYKQPGFWVGFFSNTSDTSEQVVKTPTEIYNICLKLDRGVITIGDANVELVKRINYLNDGANVQLAKELKDNFVDNIVGLGNFSLILLGVISTIIGIAAGIKSLSKK